MTLSELKGEITRLLSVALVIQKSPITKDQKDFWRGYIQALKDINKFK